MATVPETLNNAIYSLASLNPSSRAIQNLNVNWVAFWQSTGTERSMPVPPPLYWAQLKGYWLAYSGARALADHTNERTPEASAIDPTLWKTVVDANAQGAEAIKDASRAALQGVSELANVLKPWLLAAGVAVVAILLMRRR